MKIKIFAYQPVPIVVQIGTYGGKGTGERMLLLDMFHHFKKGDIIMADALYCTYS